MKQKWKIRPLHVTRRNEKCRTIHYMHHSHGWHVTIGLTLELTVVLATYVLYKYARYACE